MSVPDDNGVLYAKNGIAACNRTKAAAKECGQWTAEVYGATPSEHEPFFARRL